MALNDETKRFIGKQIGKLSITQDGIGAQKRREGNIVNVFIGLGGAGTKTVDMLAKKCKTSFRELNRTFFYAVDDARTSLEGLENIDANNKIDIYDSNSVGFPALHAPWIDSWKSQEFPPADLTHNGAGQVRQKGRMFLAGKYQTLYAVMTTAAAAAGKARVSGSPIEVTFVIGTGGGTGSGTFIDMAYIVREAFSNNLPANSFEMSAYLYTSDVYYLLPPFSTDPMAVSNKKSINANCIAALKENNAFIDTKSFPIEYHFEEPNGTHRSRESIFTSCTIVQGYRGGISTELEEIQNNLANFLSYSICDVAIIKNNQSKQLGKEIKDNANHTTEMYLSSHTNEPCDLKYSYSAVGFCEMPMYVNEIKTICANELTQALLNYFDTEPTPQETMNVAGRALYGGAEKNPSFIQRNFGFENIASAVVYYAILSTIKFDTFSTNYLCHNSDQVKKCNYTAKAIDFVSQMTRNGLFNKAFYNYNQNVINLIANIIDGRTEGSIDNNSMFAIHGPFYCLRMYKGIVDILSILTSDQERNESSYRNYERIKIITTKLDSISHKLVKTKKDIEEYNNYLTEYIIRYAIKEEIFCNGSSGNSGFIGTLGSLKNSITEHNNEVFEIYTCIFNNLLNVLRDDNSAIIETSRTNNAGGIVFSVSPIDMEGFTNHTSDLYGLIHNSLALGNIKEFADKIIEDMCTNKDTWLSVNNEALFGADKRLIAQFNDRFTAFANDTVQKFIVTEYNPDMDDAKKAALFSDVQVAWSNYQSELNVAARNILEKLDRNGGLLAESHNYSNLSNLNNFGSDEIYVLLGSTPDLNNEIIALLGGKNYGITYNGTEIAKITQKFNLPLYTFRGIIESQNDYISIANTDLRGLHINEVEDDWTKFPAVVPNSVFEHAHLNLLSEELEIYSYVKEDVLNAIKKGCLAYDSDNEKYLLKYAVETITGNPAVKLNTYAQKAIRDHVEKTYSSLDLTLPADFNGDVDKYYEDLLESAITNCADLLDIVVGSVNNIGSHDYKYYTENGLSDYQLLWPAAGSVVPAPSDVNDPKSTPNDDTYKLVRNQMQIWTNLKRSSKFCDTIKDYFETVKSEVIEKYRSEIIPDMIDKHINMQNEIIGSQQLSYTDDFIKAIGYGVLEITKNNLNTILTLKSGINKIEIAKINNLTISSIEKTYWLYEVFCIFAEKCRKNPKTLDTLREALNNTLSSADTALIEKCDQTLRSALFSDIPSLIAQYDMIGFADKVNAEINNPVNNVGSNVPEFGKMKYISTTEFVKNNIATNTAVQILTTYMNFGSTINNILSSNVG